jgi:hypothetical protein
VIIDGKYVSVSSAIWKGLSAAGVDMGFLNYEVRDMIQRIDPYLESLEKRIDALEKSKGAQPSEKPYYAVGDNGESGERHT